MPATAEAPTAKTAPVLQAARAAPVLTTEELRRAALARSARRNAAVARQRVARRQAWRLLRLLLVCLLPLAVWGSLADAPGDGPGAPMLRWAFEPDPPDSPDSPTDPNAQSASPQHARPTQEPPP
jgi:hypothetical protein